MSTKNDEDFLVFGASGFVGANFLRFLKESNCRVHTVSRLEIENRKPSNELLAKLARSQTLTVFICAGGARFIKPPNLGSEQKLIQNILKILDDLNISKTKLVYLSSNAAKIEGDRFKYSVVKRVAEDLILDSKFEAIVVRSPAIFGPGMNRESHLRKFVEKPYLLWLFSKIGSRSGISLVSVRFLFLEILEQLGRHRGKIIFEPKSLTCSFRDLYSEVRANKELLSFSPVVSANRVPWYIPKVLATIIYPLWVSQVQIDQSELSQLHMELRDSIRMLGLRRKPSLAVVTGAASGLGEAICEQLELLEIPYISVDLNALSGKKREFNLKHLLVDLSDLESIGNLFIELDRHPEIEWFFSCAGQIFRGNLEDLPPNSRQRLWGVLVLARLNFYSYMLQKSRVQYRAVLINISSSSGVIPLSNYLDYSIANSALIQAHKVLANSVSTLDVKTIVPGGMRTNLMKDFTQDSRFASFAMEPIVVARLIIRELKASRTKLSFVGRNAVVMSFIRLILPYNFSIKLMKILATRLR